MTEETAPTSPREFMEDPFRRRYRIVLFFLFFAICAYVRLFDLDHKTMMHDELLFTNYSYYDLYENWSYRYQPILHGPLMLHIQNVVFHVFGPSDYTVRLGAALLGVFAFFFLWKLRYWLGEAGTWFVLGFYAIAPGIAFFHRFFHQDSLYLFNSLWIICSLANWWRTRDGRWAASAVIAVTALFNTKASAVFLYFTIGTFVLLLIIHDLVGYILAGKAERLENFLGRVPKFPPTAWVVLVFSGIVVLVLTQVFEGLVFSLTPDERKLLGHGWVLQNVRSIPVMLGWMDLNLQSAPDAGATRTRGFWTLFYAALLIGTTVAAFAVKFSAEQRIGRTEFLTNFWRRIHENRWFILGGIAFSIAFYLLIYTTFLKHEIGFFQIYRDTWAYWGGQHEIGRIKGPFHQHMLNMFVYEFPAVLVVLAAWFLGVFRLRWNRLTGFSFLLMIIAVGAFHKLMFSGIQVIPEGRGVPVDADVNFLKNIFFAGAIIGITTLLFPRSGRVLGPLSLFALIVYSIAYFSSAEWANLLNKPVYKDGMPVQMMGGHTNLRNLIEVQFNFDGGTSLAMVLVLIFFATIFTWQALSEGKRFLAFSIWWLVTMTGSASYAREAVPQVGIHAMMPVIVLAGLYWNQFIQSNPQLIVRRLAYIGLGALVLWNVKTCVNLNFRYPNDPRERMAYGPSNDDVKAHMNFIREYAKIAPLREENGQLAVYRNYNDPGKFKDVDVFIKRLDQVTWPAKWYLRHVDYEEGSDPTNAIQQNYEFIFVAVDDVDRYPELKQKYNLMRGRGTTFWTPDMISPKSLANIWKQGIPGHYLDNTGQAPEAFNAKRDWYTIWRYLLMRETFDGTGRQVPSISSFEYVFCYRKDLY